MLDISRTTMDEIWIEFSPKYYISNHGRLKSFNQYEEDGRILKQANSQYGFPLCQYYVGGKQKLERTHKLVMRVFEPDLTGDRLNHKDGNRKNNRLDNLEFKNNN